MLIKLLLLGLLTVTVWGQLFDAYESSQVLGMLQNKAFVQTQAKCSMASEADSAALCDRIGRVIRANVPEAIRTLKCPGKCSNKEMRTIAQAYDVMVKDHSEIWNKLLVHFKVSDEQKVALIKWMDESRALPDDV